MLKFITACGIARQDLDAIASSREAHATRPAAKPQPDLLIQPSSILSCLIDALRNNPIPKNPRKIDLVYEFMVVLGHLIFAIQDIEVY